MHHRVAGFQFGQVAYLQIRDDWVFFALSPLRHDAADQGRLRHDRKAINNKALIQSADGDGQFFLAQAL